jgi:hypothetical protein
MFECLLPPPPLIQIFTEAKQNKEKETTRLVVYNTQNTL